MATPKKLGNRGGVKEWQALATLGDVRCLLRWTVHSFRHRTLEQADVAVFSQRARALQACARVASTPSLRLFRWDGTVEGSRNPHERDLAVTIVYTKDWRPDREPLPPADTAS